MARIFSFLLVLAFAIVTFGKHTNLRRYQHDEPADSSTVIFAAADRALEGIASMGSKTVDYTNR